MKRLLILTAVLSTAFYVTSCNQEDYNLYPEKYLRILSIKEDKVINCNLNKNLTEYKDSVLVLKGGGKPDSKAVARLEVMTLDEACSAFGYSESMIEIIPENSYEISSGGDIVIEASERHSYVPVTFNPSAIYETQSGMTSGKTLVLPLVLKSLTDTINTEYNKVLFQIEVKGSSIVWKEEGDFNVELTYMSKEISLGLDIIFGETNIADINCSLDMSGKESLVESYNSIMGTAYEPLPDQAFEFGGFNIPAGSTSVTSTMTIRRDGLVSDNTYILPLKIETDSDLIDNTTDIVRYMIISNPKYSYEDIDRKNWKVIYANSQDQWKGGLPTNYFFASRIIDGDTGTTWSANWNGAVITGDDYDYSFGTKDYVLHNFTGKREIPDIILVIDMGAEELLGGVGFQFGTQDSDYNDLIDCEWYISSTFEFKTMQDGGTKENYNTLDDGNDWKLLLESKDTPDSKSSHWYYASQSVEGRYLKIRPTKLRRGPSVCSLGEVYAKRVIAIDGIPVDGTSGQGADLNP